MKNKSRVCYGLVGTMLLMAPIVKAQEYVSPKLKQVVQQALLSNRGLKLKSYEVTKVQLEAEGVDAKKLPHVSATGLYTYINGSGQIDLPASSIPLFDLGLFEGATDFGLRSQAAFVGVSAKQIIFSGLQIPNGQKALQEKAKAQQYLVEANKENIVKDIISTFDQLMLLKEVDKLIADSEIRLKKEQEKVNKAIENGLAIPYDRDKLKLAMLELDEKKVEVEGNRNLLYKKLEQETSLSFDELNRVVYSLTPWNLSELPAGVENRLELKALNTSAKAYEYVYKKEKGASLPAVFAFGSVNYLNVFDTQLTIKDMPVVGNVDLSSNHLKLRPNFMVGVGAKWDIFTGGEHRNKLKQVKIDQEINAMKLADTEEKLNLLLEKNKVTYATSRQRYRVGEQQIKIAENNLVLATKQYEAGLIEMTERLSAENDWYKVKLNYYNNILQQRQAAMDLLHTSGTLVQTMFE
ncbi:TolC family protein [Sphingobacterium olei]|nr:TolC family protein [Sphingobacterium olei]